MRYQTGQFNYCAKNRNTTIYGPKAPNINFIILSSTSQFVARSDASIYNDSLVTPSLEG